MNRVWAAGLLSVSVTFIVAACGGGASLSPTSTPADGPTPPAESTPVVEPSPVAEPTPTAAEEPTAAEGDTTATVTPEPKYRWEVMTVDDPGSKPSLALDSQGTPHIAYILEAMP